MKKLFLFIWHIPRNIVIGMVSVYQFFLSPDHSFWAKTVKPFGYCKFQPSCSAHMKEALRKYGLLRGMFKGLYRIGRCNPWSDGGHDPA